MLKSFELIRRLCALTVTAEATLRHAQQNVELSTAAWDRVQRILEGAEQLVESGVGGAHAVKGAVNRAAAMMSLQLDTVELPVRTAVAFVHGVRVAVAALGRSRRERAQLAPSAHQGEQHV